MDTIASSSPARIVVVDDNPADVRLLRYALDSLGEEYELEVLSDGEQALQFVHLQRVTVSEPTPCVIILDLHLPKYDGKTVLQAARHTPELAHVRVVVLTSVASPEEEAAVREMGVALYRNKPSGLDEFELVAREILAICKGLSLRAVV